jgi:hypothetical protein
MADRAALVVLTCDPLAIAVRAATARRWHVEMPQAAKPLRPVGLLSEHGQRTGHRPAESAIQANRGRAAAPTATPKNRSATSRRQRPKVA